MKRGQDLVGHLFAIPEREDAELPRTAMASFRVDSVSALNLETGSQRTNGIWGQRSGRGIERGERLQKLELQNGVICEMTAGGETQYGDERELGSGRDGLQ